MALRGVISVVLLMGMTAACTVQTTAPARGPASQPVVPDGSDVVAACINQVNATGTYDLVPGSPPQVTAIAAQGGTQSGANAINACLQRRATGVQTAAITPSFPQATAPLPQSFPSGGRQCPPGASVLYGGVAIC